MRATNVANWLPICAKPVYSYSIQVKQGPYTLSTDSPQALASYICEVISVIACGQKEDVLLVTVQSVA